jgi:hypothetical protein
MEHLILLRQGPLCAILMAYLKGGVMPSNTKMTELKRKKKKANLGKKRKKQMGKNSTPAFAVHVDKE